MRRKKKETINKTKPFEVLQVFVIFIDLHNFMSPGDHPQKKQLLKG